MPRRYSRYRPANARADCQSAGRRWFRPRGRQHVAARGDIDEALAPAAHAGFGLARVVIGRDEIDRQAVAELASRGFHRVDGGQQLLAAGHQRSAVAQAPAVVLGVRHLDALGLPFQRQRDHPGHAFGVMAVQYRVDRQRQAAGADRGGEFALFGQAVAVAGDAVGAGRIHVLHAQLHMFQPGRLQLVQHWLAASDAGGDQVAVQPECARMRDQFGQVFAQHGLAAGKMRLQHAHVGGLLQQRAPACGVHFLAQRCQRDRVGAIRARQRAAVGQFQQHR